MSIEHNMPDHSDMRQSKARRTKTKTAMALIPLDRHFVYHNYHDHSKDKASDCPILHSDEDMKDVSSDNNANGGSMNDNKRKGPRGGVIVPFPTKLHVMLTKVEEDGLGHIVSWQPHGRCFIVRDPKAFVNIVMPKHFRQSKLTSFQRQLNLYGFSRLTSGKDRGGYYHELFLRNKLFLCQSMTRIRIKGTGIKGKASPETEPDFYSMPMVVPDADTPDKTKIEEIVAAAIKESKNMPTKQSGKRQRGVKKSGTPKLLKKKEHTLDANDCSFPQVDKETSVPPIVKVAGKSNKRSSGKFGKTSFLPPVFVTPDTQRPNTSISFPGFISRDSSYVSAVAPSPQVTGFRLQSRILRHDGNKSNDMKSPFISSNSSVSSPRPLPLHHDDTVSFEGKQFHYLDSFASHEFEEMSSIPHHVPARMQWTQSSFPTLPYDIGSMSNALAPASQTASSLSPPRLIPSLQSSEPDFFDMRGPILTPSLSSSSLHGIANISEQPLDCIDPNIIFSPKSPDVDWNISKDVDIDAEFSLMDK